MELPGVGEVFAAHLTNGEVIVGVRIEDALCANVRMLSDSVARTALHFEIDPAHIIAWHRVVPLQVEP